MTWQTGFVEVGGLKLHYTRTGGNKPPLVLAHGFSDDGLCWTPVAQALEADYDVIMVDARGHGRSDGPESGYGSITLGDDLAGVIAALGLERPVVLGHSMGAATALALAANHPESVGAILLEDPPMFWLPPPPDPGDGQARIAGMHKWVVELKRKTREEMIAQERASSPGWSEAELGPWADAKLRLSFNVMGRGREPQQSLRDLPTITCPALLITADPARGAIVTPEGAEELRAIAPNLEVAHIPGAGHSIRRDQFRAYVAVVKDALRRLAA